MSTRLVVNDITDELVGQERLESALDYNLDCNLEAEKEETLGPKLGLSTIHEDKEPVLEPASDLRHVEDTEKIYYQSLLDKNITTVDQIEKVLKEGCREDHESDLSVIRYIKLSNEMVEKILSDPALERILSRMNPEQITPEIIAKLIASKSS